MLSTILDSICGILTTIIGLVILIMPYEKFNDIFPKAPSKTAVKVLGVVVVICGIVVVVLTSIPL